jgi:hypothetical protein
MFVSSAGEDVSSDSNDRTQGASRKTGEVNPLLPLSVIGRCEGCWELTVAAYCSSWTCWRRLCIYLREESVHVSAGEVEEAHTPARAGASGSRR